MQKITPIGFEPNTIEFQQTIIAKKIGEITKPATIAGFTFSVIPIGLLSNRFSEDLKRLAAECCFNFSTIIAAEQLKKDTRRKRAFMRLVL